MTEMTKREESFYRRLGGNIKQARLDADVTQVQLAEKLGITQPMLAKYENGTRRIPAWLLPSIAKTLKACYNQLLDGKK